MNRHVVRSAQAVHRISRASGDEPLTVYNLRGRLQYFPHERG